MNKALRFVWLSLLTLICGVASAGTVVFDPTVDTGGGKSITKNGITFEVLTAETEEYLNLNPRTNSSGETYWQFRGRFGVKTDLASGGSPILSVTFEILDGTFINPVWGYNPLTYSPNSTDNRKIYLASDKTYGEAYNGEFIKWQSKNGSNYYNAFITKVIVEYVGEDSPDTPDDGSITIAKLLSGAEDVKAAKIRFTDAQVVYKEGNAGSYNYIVRENNQALDILNTSLNLKQGQYLTGTVVLNVNYNSGILTTSDVTGLTDATKLVLSGDELNEPLPISCATISEMTNHPGDLVMIENRKCYKSYLGFYIHEYQPTYKVFYFSNEAGLVASKNYHITAWYNSILSYNSYNYPQGKVIKAEPVITTLAPPTISGEETFTKNTTVTITASESVASIYYTLDGTKPTTESILYKDPFVLDKTTTVKAIAVYKTVMSPVASMDFHLIDLSAPQTICDLALMEKNLESVTVRFDNAKVVYGEKNNFILRENINGKDYALDVLNTELPLTVGATMSGTVMLKIGFKPNVGYSNGVLSTSDVAETNADNLTIVPGANTLPSPIVLDASNFSNVYNYPGDILDLSGVKGWNYVSYRQLWIGSVEVNLTNGEDYGISSNVVYDNILIWYNDVFTDGKSPLAKIVGKKENYDYTLTAAGWGTIIIPFDCEKPEGLTVYECTSVNEGKLVVEEVNSFKANTPYLLKGPKDVDTTYPLEGYAAKHEDKYEKGVMVGVYSWQEPPADSYVLQNQDEGLAFYRHLAGNGVEVGPNRCYIKPQSGELKSIQFPDDETNGVAYANATDSTLVDVYTTAGVKVKHQVEMGKALNDLPAGLYIINNKKIVKK